MTLVECDGDAFARVVEDWKACFPDTALLALLPEAEKERIPELQSLCRALDVPLAGAVFPALVTSAGFTRQGLVLCRLDRQARMALLPDIDGDPEEAADRLCRAVEDALSTPTARTADPTLFLFFDGLVGTIASVLDRVYLRLADRVTYVGANAGSETFQPMPCLFDERRVIGRGALALLIDTPLRTVLEHGYTAPERVMTATSTEGNAIQSIDWRPAFEVYREIIGEEYGVELTRENFYQYAVHFPVGLLRAADDVVVRIPVALGDEGALVCIGEVPENAVLTLLRAPGANAEGCVDRLARSLRGDAPTPPPDVLTFYCAGRRLHLGEAAERELDALRAGTAATRVAGALSLGEIGCVGHWGYPMFHNATLVCTTPLTRQPDAPTP